MVKNEMQEVQKEIKDLLYSIHSESTYNWLVKIGFFEAPASSSYHGAYPGGLAKHSLYVAKNLIELTDKMGLKWSDTEADNFSPIMVGLLHDVCKVDLYEMVIDSSGYTYKKRNDSIFSHHAEKSIAMILSNQVTVLNEEEVACIRWHMGAYEKDPEEWKYLNNAIHKYPNVLWTHTADMMASHIQGV